MPYDKKTGKTKPYPKPKVTKPNNNTKRGGKKK